MKMIKEKYIIIYNKKLNKSYFLNNKNILM